MTGSSGCETLSSTCLQRNDPFPVVSTDQEQALKVSKPPDKVFKQVTWHKFTTSLT